MNKEIKRTMEKLAEEFCKLIEYIEENIDPYLKHYDNIRTSYYNNIVNDYGKEAAKYWDSVVDDFEDSYADAYADYYSDLGI